MKYFIKAAHDSNPQVENAQTMALLDLFNCEDDELVKEICESIQGIRDCTFYYEEANISCRENKIDPEKIAEEVCSSYFIGIPHTIEQTEKMFEAVIDAVKSALEIK